MVDDSHYIKTLFEKYNIDSIFLKLDNKYETTLIDRIVYDYRVLDKQGFVTSKWDTLSSFFIKSTDSFIFVIISAESFKNL